MLKKSWLVSLRSHPLIRFFFLWTGGNIPTSVNALPFSGQYDLVEVRLRQLSYQIGPTLVSSGPSSALLAPDCTKNAGNISLFEPPSATTLTKGPLLILDHIYSHPHIRVRSYRPPPAHHPRPIYPSHPLFKRKKNKKIKTSAPKAELGWTLGSRLETFVSFPKTLSGEG